MAPYFANFPIQLAWAVLGPVSAKDWLANDSLAGLQKMWFTPELYGQKLWLPGLGYQLAPNLPELKVHFMD